MPPRPPASSQRNHARRQGPHMPLFLQQQKEAPRGLRALWCAKAGKLLRYLVFRRGIEANPGKIHTITEISPPTNAKGV